MPDSHRDQSGGFGMRRQRRRGSQLGQPSRARIVAAADKVQALGGSIEVNSRRPGQGTAILVELPLQSD
ncbi:MAG: hypothetical protein V7646_5658 [Pseudonocardia sp.]